MQRFTVDRGLFAIAAFYDGLFTVEHIADEQGGASHVAFGNVDAVMPRVIPVVPHPSGAWVDAVVLFVGVAVRRQIHGGSSCALPFYFEGWIDLHFDDWSFVVAAAVVRRLRQCSSPGHLYEGF